MSVAKLNQLKMAAISVQQITFNVDSFSFFLEKL